MPSPSLSAVLLLASLLGACAGGGYAVPDAPPGALRAASAEIGGGVAPARRELGDAGAQDAIRRVVARLAPAGAAVCREIGAGACAWRFLYDPDPELNAAATGQGAIVVQRGAAEYARNDDELAFVIAHEMAHHAADHVRATQGRAQLGSLLGGLLAGAAASYTGLQSPELVQGAAGLGGQIGVISYSKAQEREADALGAAILHSAGFDVDRARLMLLSLARLSDRQETRLLDSHPAGPDRVATFDASVAELRANNWQLRRG